MLQQMERQETCGWRRGDIQFDDDPAFFNTYVVTHGPLRHYFASIDPFG
jgi:hypothetical protein